MIKAEPVNVRSALFLVLGLGLALPACGGSEPAAAPPPSPPPSMAAQPASSTPSPPTPVARVETPPPAPPKHHHGHGMADLLMASLDSLDLKPEQKTAVQGIESDFEKFGDAPKEQRAKLESDVADGVAAGKLDHKKIDPDIAALSAAATATEPGIQDAFDRLHKTLDASQRKQLVETMRSKGKEMHEHGGMTAHGDMGPGEHGEKLHEGKATGDGKGPGHEGKGPGGHEHEGMGPGGHEHEGMGPGGHEHEGMGEGPLMKLSDELMLTPDQKEKLHAKLEAQMKTNHAAMKAKWEAAEKHMDAIGTAFESETFDAKKAGVGAQAPDMVKTVATERVQFVETVLSVLTPEQRAKFAAHLKEEHAGDAADPS